MIRCDAYDVPLKTLKIKPCMAMLYEFSCHRDDGYCILSFGCNLV